MKRIYLKEEVLEAIQKVQYIVVYITWRTKSFPLYLSSQEHKEAIGKMIDEQDLADGVIEVYDYSPDNYLMLIKESII